MKQTLLNLMRATGAFTFFRLLNRHRALILTYHRFSKREDEWSTSASAFIEQLKYLTAHYRIVPLSQLVERLNGTLALPPGLAAITIDDGYRDAYEIAFPILRRFGVPATLYVVTEFVDGRRWLWTDKVRFLTAQASAQELMITLKGEKMRFKLCDEASRLSASERINEALKQVSDEVKDEEIARLASRLDTNIPEFPPDKYAAVSWQQLREMDEIGIEIGSHTLTHPILTNIGDQRLRRELNDSRLQLEGVLKRRIEHFCYPNGNYDERVLSEVACAGYRVAVTCASGLNSQGDDLLALRRIHTEYDLEHFMQSTSGFEQLKDRVRAMSRRTPLATQH